MTKAFDTALFIPPNPVVGDAVEAESIGAPGSLVTQWARYILGAPGITVAASLPAATQPGQTLVAGSAPSFSWLAEIPSVPGLPVATAQGQILTAGPAPAYAWQANDPAAQVPLPTGNNQTLLSMGPAPFQWVVSSLSNNAFLGGAVMTGSGGNMAQNADINFAISSAYRIRLNGNDPAWAGIDNFTIDCGTY